MPLVKNWYDLEHCLPIILFEREIETNLKWQSIVKSAYFSFANLGDFTELSITVLTALKKPLESHLS